MSQEFRNEATSHSIGDAPPLRSPIASLSMKCRLGGLIGAFLLADFVFFPSARYVREQLALSGFLDAFCAGLILAQMGLLSVLAALGTGQALQRQLLIVSLLFFAVLASVAGLFDMDMMVGDVYVLPSEQIGPFLYVVPLLFLASEIPLWIFRIFFRWRIASPNFSHLTRTAPTVTLAGLILTTAAVALAIACARAGQQLYDETTLQSWWETVLFAMILVIVVNSFFPPAVVYCVLRLKSLRTILLIGSGTVLLFWLLILLWFLFLVLSEMIDDVDVPLLSLAMSFFGLIAGLFVPLLGFRFAGYRL